MVTSKQKGDKREQITGGHEIKAVRDKQGIDSHDGEIVRDTLNGPRRGSKGQRNDRDNAGGGVACDVEEPKLLS